MSTEEWEKMYRDSWLNFFSISHMKTVMRRAAATPGMSAGNMLFLLLWFYTCIAFEKVDPLQGGYFRFRFRKDRRPTLPVESPLVFYPRFVWDLVSKHARLAREIVRFYHLRRNLKRDPEARHYTDQALTPVSDAEFESLELFTVLR